jgi:xanthine/uracil permease
MMSLTVWGKGKLRLYSVLIGMIAGYVAAVDFGFLGPAQFSSQTLPKLPAPSAWPWRAFRTRKLQWVMMVPRITRDASGEKQARDRPCRRQYRKSSSPQWGEGLV